MDVAGFPRCPAGHDHAFGRPAAHGQTLGLLLRPARLASPPFVTRTIPHCKEAAMLSAQAVIAALAILGAGGETVLLDFYSDSCPPCRQMAPTVDRLAARAGDGPEPTAHRT